MVQSRSGLVRVPRRSYCSRSHGLPPHRPGPDRAHHRQPANQGWRVQTGRGLSSASRAPASTTPAGRGRPSPHVEPDRKCRDGAIAGDATMSRASAGIACGSRRRRRRVEPLFSAVRRRRRRLPMSGSTAITLASMMARFPASVSTLRRHPADGRKPSGGQGGQQQAAGPGSTTENVIPLSGDFFVFGGLYRNVALVITDACACRHDGCRRPWDLCARRQHRR